MTRSTFSTVFVLTLAYSLAAPAHGAEQRTGTHLDSRAAAQPDVLHLSRPGEIDEILYLIESGQADAAVERAREHVASLSAAPRQDKAVADSARYFALNALCVALMSAGQTDSAIEQCSAAIDESPNRWTAWNSRGTTHFASRNFGSALTDFEQALRLAPGDSRATATIERNIELTRLRLTD